MMARKPVFSYRTAVGAMVALSGLSALVWAHHMFTSGWAPTLGGPFMVTTELISIPTGIFFLVLDRHALARQRLDEVAHGVDVRFHLQLHRLVV